MKDYTVKFPLSVEGGKSTFKTINESRLSELVKFNMKSVILTCPGERRRDLDFGVCAKKYIFEFFSTGETEELYNSIVEQIEEYIPYCAITNISINTYLENPNSLKITIGYRIPDINKKDIFELILSN